MNQPGMSKITVFIYMKYYEILPENIMASFLRIQSIEFAGDSNFYLIRPYL